MPFWVHRTLWESDDVFLDVLESNWTQKLTTTTQRLISVLASRTFKLKSTARRQGIKGSTKLHGYSSFNLYSRLLSCLGYSFPILPASLIVLVVFFVLQKHTGLLALLDEASRFPTSTDKSLAQKFHSNHGKKHKTIYIAPRDSGTSFSIKHYAGVVSGTWRNMSVQVNERSKLKHSLFSMV